MPHTIALPIEHKDHPARRAARAYARKCWWASYEDLEQEAFRATTQAMRTYDPLVGVPIDAYLFRAAVLALKPMLLRDSAPVSASRRKLDNLKGLRRVSRDMADGVHAVADNAHNPEHVILTAELAVDLHAWRQRVRQRLHALLDGSAKLALPILLDGATSADVAAEAQVPLKEVYNATLKARRRLTNDRQMWSLWREML